MACGACIRWRRLQRPRLAPRNWSTRYGFCRWPGFGPKPYWQAKHPEGELLVADRHGEACPAFKAKKAR